MWRKFDADFWLLVTVSISVVLINSVNPADDSDFRIIFPVDEAQYEGDKCETHSGSKGICRTLEECTDNREPIKPSDLCTFNRNDAVYCCPVDHIAETDIRFGAEQSVSQAPKNSDNITKPKPLRPIDQICEHYYPSKSLQDEKAQISNQESSPMASEPYSYMATFGWKKKKNKIDWKCVGVVIAENIIITNAHCINSKSILPDLAGILHKGSRQIFNITAIYSHSDYNQKEIYHNIAVVKVIPNFAFSKMVKPACVWASNELPNDFIYRVGYTGAEMKQVFQKNATIIENKDCGKKFKNGTELPRGISSEIFCSVGNDKCLKDTGGAVQMHIIQDENGRPFVTGIASTGNYCRGSIPVLYTRIASYLDWVEPFLKKEV